MPQNTSLIQHYAYWDHFFEDWKGGRNNSVYMPEPWWGWCLENGDLHSVTLNHNPDKSNKLQTRRCIGCAAGNLGKKYSALMFDGTLRNHLYQTEDWHYQHQYKPLMCAIGADENFIAKDTRHHLSIELAPFNDNEGNSAYSAEKKKDVIIQNTLLFAAKAAQRIVSPGRMRSMLSLNNIVFVGSTIQAIEKFAGAHINKDEDNDLEIIMESKSKEIHTFRLLKEKYPYVSDVLFVCISGTLNSLSRQQYMNEIINQINNGVRKQ